MISKKDNLLVRPWQQRKFNYHKQKIYTALPVIDNRPPPFRAHVCVKLKKQQKEKDRCKRIEHDNYLLLQRLNYVTKTSRVDNTWKTPQPNFLNRVGLYQTYAPQIEDLIALDFTDTDEEEDRNLRLRRAKCYACTPEKNPIEKPKIPEDRIPWEPDKNVCIKPRSKSVPVRKPQHLPSIMETHSVSKPSSSKSSERTKPINKIQAKISEFHAKQPQSIVFNRGCLQLSVNFPSDTIVKLEDGKVEKILIHNLCHCKNSPAKQ